MRFHSLKTSQKNKINLFRALFSGLCGFVVPQNTLASAVFKNPTNIRNLTLKLFAFSLLLCASFIVRASVVQSDTLPLSSEIETKDTIHVYPSTVENSAWAGVENVLTPDLGEDAIYQDFSARNAAYVPLSSPIVPQVKSDAQSGTPQTGNATAAAVCNDGGQCVMGTMYQQDLCISGDFQPHQVCCTLAM